MAVLLLIAVGWIYIVVLMAAAEAFSPSGSVLGAVVTFVLYGVLPLGVVLYIGSTGLRRRARARADATTVTGSRSDASPVEPAVAKAPRDSARGGDPGGGGHAAGAPLPPEREEP